MRHVILLSAIVLVPCVAQESLPPAWQTLKENYTRAIVAANKPITDRYVQQLTRLKAEAMKAGKLDDAVAIDKEISSVSSLVAADSKPKVADLKLLVDEYVGTWASKGRWPKDHQFILDRAGTARDTWKTSGTWTITEKALVIKWRNGHSHEYRVTKNRTVLDGIDIKPNGDKNAELSYERKP